MSLDLILKKEKRKLHNKKVLKYAMIETFYCECGSKLTTRTGLKFHFKTKKHNKFICQIN